ncbi:MAG TPA: L,D-transpeptidase [Flavipsychrobacter sp.]|nr:L,D-transpeptidase [Flavipsychrobacter sp.]
MRQILLSMALTVAAIGVKAQGYVDQEKTASLSDAQSASVDHIQKVVWHVYDYKKVATASKKGPWTQLLNHLDSLPGGQQGLRREIVELANRVTGDKLKTGRKLVIPSAFPDDYKAYSPYPFHYAAAADFPKLFIIDKYTQTFGAYENGQLVRWGLVSTGTTNNLTPNGKFNFTWKAEYRESSAAPPGEVWEMRYMFNFEPKEGIHVHQYALPISSPASHGCVRVSMADAIWNYHWADGSQGKTKGTPVWVINHNPVGRAAHWYATESGGVRSLVRLPEDDKDAFANN